MKAKEWELECAKHFKWCSDNDLATADRYGVKGFFTGEGWRPVPSLPDFEGALPTGQQFIFDCKVCSGPSFPLSSLRKERSKQIEHMLERSRFNVICFFAVYFNEHKTQRDYYPPKAYAFPVHKDHPLWRQFSTAALSTITRLACDEYAVPIEFVTPPRCRNPRPDVLSAICSLAVLFATESWTNGSSRNEEGEAAEANADPGHGAERTASSAGQGGRVREGSASASAPAGEGRHLAC